ncbi:MAG: OFA family MFS transporter [Tepidisphaerales bacterium]
MTTPQAIAVACADPSEVRLKNRWLVAACAVCIHLCIGSVYAYSVMTKPVMGLLGVTADQVKVSFSIAIFFLGIAAAFLGHFVERYGPRVSGMLSATLWGLALVGSGLAVRWESLWLLYLSYGVLGGIGLGVGYITPVSTLVKWFPDKRGMATGLAIMGFGFAAMLAGPLMAWMFNAGTSAQPLYTTASVSRTFFLCGAAYFVVMMLASQYLAPPPKGYVPAGWMPPLTSDGKVRCGDLAQLTANEALRTRRFYFMWLMLGINITCGIALISVASPMMQAMLKMSPLEAGGVVGLIGVFNGIGRIIWASLSDYLGRPATYITFFVLQIVAYAALPSIQHVLLFQIVLYLIMTCYGGGFATVPAFLGDLFGTKQLGAVHGYTLTAWSVAGIVGPSVLVPLVHIESETGAVIGTDYPKLLYLCSGLFAVALLTSLLMVADIRAKRRAIARAEAAATPTAPATPGASA